LFAFLPAAAAAYTLRSGVYLCSLSTCEIVQQTYASIGEHRVNYIYLLFPLCHTYFFKKITVKELSFFKICYYNSLLSSPLSRYVPLLYKWCLLRSILKSRLYHTSFSLNSEHHCMNKSGVVCLRQL
jgi:hypothetical protein